jgi:photosystem II stability/assembly factor-like uncharacterized protein
LLRDVLFLDTLRGWAVGDRGVIWHTADGGRNWQLQPSGVTEPLHSICFSDENHGWAAGGATDPHTLVSRGVLLNTRDGGRTWRTETAAAQLPIVRRVKFLSLNQGWAIGESSALHPSGVFYTNDGGRKWADLPIASPIDPQGLPALATQQPDWLAGDFVDPLIGALAGRRGLVAGIRNRALQASGGPGFGVRGLRRMQLASDGRGWLVGDGGLLLATADAGLSWQVPRGGLPGRAAEFFDLCALAMLGNHCWVAGSPGTCVFHSPDGGNSWRLLPTRQNLPIHGLHFRDEQNGWAVGALGTILATADGGRTWRVQRSGGTRAAVLALVADADALPLELLAQLCGNDGYLGAAEIVCRRDLDQGPAARQAAAERGHEAVVSVGGCSAGVAWQFPLRQPGVATRSEQFLDGWNRVNDGRGLARLQEYLVRQIRTWRPEIVISHAASPQGDDPLGRLIHQAVLQAVPAAADGQQFAWLAHETGLAPWKVKKVFGALPSGTAGDVTLSAAQWAPNLGRSPAEAAAPARALVAEGAPAQQGIVAFQLSTNSLPPDNGRETFFSGIALHAAGEARRALPAADNFETLRRSAEKHRNVRAIVERAEREPVAAGQLLGQMGDLTKDLTAEAAGQMLFDLAQRYYRTGQAELAADTLELLVERHPRHPVAGAAQVRLLHYWSSSEVAWRLQAAQRATVQEASAVVDPRDPFGRKVMPAGGAALPVGVGRIDKPSRAMVTGSRPTDRPARATQIGKELERAHPALFAEPRVRFPLAVAQIQRGFSRDAERFYLAQRRGQPGDPWQRLAAGEEWLATRQAPPPVSATRCPRVPAKPYLDGKLDDAAWQSAPPQELRSRLNDDKTWRATVQLACDDEYLYLAATCQRPPAAAAKTDRQDGPRPRDADLSQHDRLELLLDLDRDYATYYRLAVDCRGFTADSCWGDATWDPEWFVAAGGHERTWTIEAAIPWAELTGTPPHAPMVWAIGVQRTVPGVGFQSWSLPASTAVQPEGFGYLLFE